MKFFKKSYCRKNKANIIIEVTLMLHKLFQNGNKSYFFGEMFKIRLQFMFNVEKQE